MVDQIQLLNKILEVQKKLLDFVCLRKDDKGYYLEYAFSEGVPKDNRCLSWYITGSEKYNIKPRFTVNRIYELIPCTCDGHCKIGHPTCKTTISHWDYNNPIKCACWNLGAELDINHYVVCLSLGTMCDIINEYKESWKK